MSKQTTLILPIDSIIADQRIYPRISTHDPVTEQYAVAMVRGDKFPPIVVTHLNGLWFLVDGFHRLGARLINMRKYGKRENDPYEQLWSNVECQSIKCKSLEEAYVEGIKRNATHGVPFEPAERMIIATNLSELGYTTSQISDILRVTSGEAERMVIKAVERIPTYVTRRIRPEEPYEPFDVTRNDRPKFGPNGNGHKFFTPTYTFDSSIVEQVAAIFHQEWVRWSTQAATNRAKGYTEGYIRTLKHRWVPYQQLSEEDKVRYRAAAKKVLAVIWAN